MLKIMTISIAAYNVEKYIEHTLNSLIVPDVMDDLEVLIVNDGSKDKTAEIAQQYVEQYPNTFKLINKENGGWGSTVNTAIEFSSGKYFKLLDGDDWFDSGNLKEYICFLKNTNVDLVFTQFTKHYEGSQSRELVEQRYEYNKNFNVSTIDDVCMHALTVKTKLLQYHNVRLLEHCFYTDVEFFIRSINVAEQCISIPLNIYCYRLGREGQSVSLSQGYLKHISEHRLVVEAILPIVYSNNKLKTLQKELNTVAVHVGLLLFFEPNKYNYEKFIEFKKYLHDKYPQSLRTKNMSFATKLAFRFPRIFYKPISWLKRKRHKIK